MITPMFTSLLRLSPQGGVILFPSSRAVVYVIHGSDGHMTIPYSYYLRTAMNKRMFHCSISVVLYTSRNAEPSLSSTFFKFSCMTLFATDSYRCRPAYCISSSESSYDNFVLSPSEQTNSRQHTNSRRGSWPFFRDRQAFAYSNCMPPGFENYDRRMRF